MFRSSMTLDSKQRKMTAFVMVIAALSLVLGPLSLLGGSVTGAFAITPIILVSVALAWAMSPRAVAVTDGELRIERRAWAPLRVPLASIASAASVPHLDVTLRLFGVGGLFGSFGLFQSGSLGRFRLYATRGGRTVVLRRGGKLLPVAFTPDDVDGTLRSLGGLASGAAAI